MKRMKTTTGLTGIGLIVIGLLGCGGRPDGAGDRPTEAGAVVGQPFDEATPADDTRAGDDRLDPGRQLNDVQVGDTVVGQARWSAATRLWHDPERVLEVVPGESVTLALAAGEALEVGGVLVGRGPTGAFVGRMIGITRAARGPSGSAEEVVTVALAPVDIEDMFDELSIRLRNQPVRQSAPQPQAGASTVLVDDDVMRAVAAAAFELDPSPDFDLALDLDFDFFVPTGVEAFRAIFTAGVANRIDIDLTVKKPFSNRNHEKKILDEALDPIGVNISGVELSICPSMRVFVGIDGSSIGTGTIRLSGLANASTRIGVECPEDQDCDGLFEFPFDVDVNLEPELRGGGANILAYSRAEFELEVLCSPTLASATLALQPQMEIAIERRPSRPASVLAFCDGFMTQGNERVKSTVEAGAHARIDIDLTLFEDTFRFDLFDEQLLQDCHIFLAEPPVVAPIGDTEFFTVLDAQTLEFTPGVEVSEVVNDDGEVVFRLGNDGSDGGTLRCRCPEGSFGACLGSYPIDGGPATCEFECEDSGGHALPCAWRFTPAQPGFTSGINIGDGGRLAGP